MVLDNESNQRMFAKWFVAVDGTFRARFTRTNDSAVSSYVRRLRDTGMKNGLNYTLNIIGFISPMFPIIGMIYKIVLLVLLCMPTGKFQKE